MRHEPDFDGSEWRDGMLLSRSMHSPGDRSALLRRARSGELTRITRGAYLPSSIVESLDAGERYRVKIAAIQLTSQSEPVFSHQSAAALWRLPNQGHWPDTIHTLAATADGGRSTTALTRHAVGIPPQTPVIDGCRVTTLSRTAADLACSTDFRDAVIALDSAMHRTAHPEHKHDAPVPAPAGGAGGAATRESILFELTARSSNRGLARARRALDFADGDACLPGESVSRVTMHAAGIEPPMLQQRLEGASGRMWTVDFWWPAHSLIGEFDGRAKYEDPRYLKGRTPAQVLYDEKLREDDLRAARHSFVRWNWATSHSPRLLGRLLRSAMASCHR